MKDNSKVEHNVLKAVQVNTSTLKKAKKNNKTREYVEQTVIQQWLKDILYHLVIDNVKQVVS